MNKLFGLFLLALACWAPDVAQAAARFAVCTATCTWDNTSTAMWSTTSGGGTGASAPTSADDVTLDAATCVGGVTCTITTFSGTISANSVVQTACTATTTGCILDLSANNTNFTVVGTNCYTNTGAGTRTINMGSGTWTCSNNAASYSINASLTYNQGTSTIAFTGTGGTTSRRLTGGAGKTFNTVTVASGTAGFVPASATITTLTVSAGNRVNIQSGTTLTVSTLTGITGSSSTPTLFTNDNPTNGAATISSGNNFACVWCGFTGIIASGGGTFSATSSADYGNNTNIAISPPSPGGGRIIGG